MADSDNNGFVKVDKGIPLPAAHFGRHSRYPWAELDVGDSFFVANATINNFSNSKAHARAKFPGREFAARTVTENGVKGIRIWRTA